MENIIESSETKEQIKLFVQYHHTIKIELPAESQLSDLKREIDNRFLLKYENNEYEIYIKDLQLMVINHELKIDTLIQTYQTNEFTIKSCKSILEQIKK
jgi:hypothetical protein